MMLAAIVAAAAKDSAIFFVLMRITILYSEKSCTELNMGRKLFKEGDNLHTANTGAAAFC